MTPAQLKLRICRLLLSWGGGPAIGACHASGTALTMTVALGLPTYRGGTGNLRMFTQTLEHQPGQADRRQGRADKIQFPRLTPRAGGSRPESPARGLPELIEIATPMETTIYAQGGNARSTGHDLYVAAKNQGRSVERGQRNRCEEGADDEKYLGIAIAGLLVCAGCVTTPPPSRSPRCRHGRENVSAGDTEQITDKNGHQVAQPHRINQSEQQQNC